MPITPIEILHKEFKRSFRGYTDAEVQDFLRDVSRDQERLIAELTRLKEDKYGLQKRLQQFERMEETLQKTLVMAQQAAEDTRANARCRADAIVAEAEIERESLIEEARSRACQVELEAARIRTESDRFEAEFRAMLAVYEELLNRHQVQDLQDASPPEESISQQTENGGKYEVLDASASAGRDVNWTRLSEE